MGITACFILWKNAVNISMQPQKLWSTKCWLIARQWTTVQGRSRIVFMWCTACYYIILILTQKCIYDNAICVIFTCMHACIGCLDTLSPAKSWISQFLDAIIIRLVSMYLYYGKDIVNDPFNQINKNKKQEKTTRKWKSVAESRLT